ncbi:MAG: TolC family protein [Pyrinomonadaceae bacterium]|nr:TolC family protein [Pyrinomonadaceae bacterium]
MLKVICSATMIFLGFSVYGISQSSERSLTRDEAIRISLDQASNFEQAKLAEKIANEDVFQARKSFYPKLSATTGFIYNSPSLARVPIGTPRPPSFLGANAITEYQATGVAAGEIDTSGRLKANQRRAFALLEAAKAGTEIARRDLIRATDEAYFGLAFSNAQRQATELNLQTALRFENTTKLLVDGGEIPPIDLLKAQIQTTTRRDELAQAKIIEQISENNLKIYLNFDESQTVSVEELQMDVPVPSELGEFTVEAVRQRPELEQFDAQKKVAEEDEKIARSERRPQVSYTLEAGAITDSIRPNRIGRSAGIRGTVSVNVPLFDWGASKSRQTQAELRGKIAESSKLFAERQFVADFNSNLNVAKAAAERIRELAKNLQESERVLGVAIDRYKAGETQILEVTDTQNLIVTLRLALLQAIFDYQVARARLRQATGK